MIILLYGQDSFRSREKLNQIVGKYKQSDKFQSGLFVFDDENFELSKSNTNLINKNVSQKNQKLVLDKFNQAITVQSFFNDKKLIVVKNIFTGKFAKDFRKALADYFDNHKELLESKEAVIVFWESNEIKNSDVFFKFLTKKDSVVKKQEFKNLTDGQLKKWIQDRLAEKLIIAAPALQNLILYTGGDLWRINNEIKKLINYKKQGEISVADVDAMVTGSVESNIFQATDALGQKDFKKALNSFRILLAKGEDKLYLFSMVVYQFRNLIKVKDLVETGAVSSDIIVKKLKMHPFVAQKTLNQSRNFGLKELKNIYRQLLDFDIKIKTGKIEPELAIDSVIYGLI